MPELTRSKAKSSRGATAALKVIPARLSEPAGATPLQKTGLETLYSAFSRRLSARLSGLLRAEIAVQFTELREEPFTNLREQAASPTCLALLSAGAESLPGVVELEFGLAMVLIESLLGGKTGAADAMSRELTEIEQHLLLDVWQALIDELAAAYKPSGLSGVRLLKLETNLSALRVFPSAEVVNCVSLEAKLGAGEWNIRIFHPPVLVKALTESLLTASNEPARIQPDQSLLLDLIAPAELVLDARLDGPRIPVKDLVGLRSGDVLHLSCPLSQPVAGFVNGTRKLTGNIVLKGRNRGFAVQSLSD